MRAPSLPRPLLAIGAAALVATAVPASAGAAPSAFVADDVPAGAAAEIAWTDGRLVRVRDAAGNRRTVARLRQAIDARDGLTLSRDGRRLAVVARDGLWIVPVTGGRPVRIGDRLGYYENVRWAPDGRRLLYNGDRTLQLCDGDVAGSCREIRDDAVDEYGSTWSPDGRTVAYVRHRPPTSRLAVESFGDLVTVDLATRRTAVVERATAGRRGGTTPTPPIWTRAGLTWSVLRLRGPDLERVISVRTRLRGADGRTRTVADVPFRGSTTGPALFLAGGEAPDGALAGFTATDDGLRPAVLGGDGRPVPTGPGFRSTDDRRVTVLGRLADGRIAVVSEASRHGRGLDEPVTEVRQSLYLVDPTSERAGAPAVVARGRSGRVSAAMAFPNDASAF